MIPLCVMDYDLILFEAKQTLSDIKYAMDADACLRRENLGDIM